MVSKIAWSSSYHAFTNLTPPIPDGIVVPQLVYSRPPAPYPTFPPIPFHHGQQSGISLHSILNGQQGNMSDSSSRPTTTTTSTKIKIRLLWPGYDEFSRDINAKEHTRQGDPIPKWKLALCVAQVVHAFYSHAVPSSNPPFGAQTWNLHNIPFQCLRLVELRQVSTGSWQPVLVYDHTA
ncbi:hypothetical protein BC629DRAFT_1440084 [Irpex lacteus]|nr:hypothetical protein BC629DRAFT_1440084 [Irpex lacteus]